MIPVENNHDYCWYKDFQAIYYSLWIVSLCLLNFNCVYIGVTHLREDIIYSTSINVATLSIGTIYSLACSDMEHGASERKHLCQ